MNAAPVRVLVVDDSDTARGLICALIAQDPRLTVCGEAADGRAAVAQAQRLLPAIITMDLRMPVLDGYGAIAEIMDRCATRILVVSDCADAAHAMAAVAGGALDATFKPGLDDGRAFTDRLWLLSGVPVIRHLRARADTGGRAGHATGPAPAAGANHAPAQAGGAVIAIASSTGGPQALARLLPALPAGLNAPVLIAQHISDGFAAGMAQWLAALCPLPVTLAREGELLRPGHIYLADSATDLTLVPGRSLQLCPRASSEIYRPSCDRLLCSVAAVVGRRSIGVILTGMGRDGARGIAAIAAAGGTTVAQDEGTSVVFGMNREAIATGGVQRVLPLEAIAAELVRLVGCAPAFVRGRSA
ncbi:chemotaxis-specific protein-glutamate methyltransferase CheB [uncultured Thiodictyon sp.]|uniref:chemotaxis-specific protein-glutamate methyltransferase CheB n=1 Tax=uncultured Thiodictyon sp. TaxID=1846217 RepID=UPI0025FC1D84|nr:chemotaxis-specific protein-glutamate methyltransferase CheB [uncultured Thiodictyon sp.]